MDLTKLSKIIVNKVTFKDDAFHKNFYRRLSFFEGDELAGELKSHTDETLSCWVNEGGF